MRTVYRIISHFLDGFVPIHELQLRNGGVIRGTRQLLCAWVGKPFNARDTRSNCIVRLQARESLGGQMQGLCGDMNGERLFEFRGPRRCVLSSGSLMTAQYQTSDRPHCSTATPHAQQKLLTLQSPNGRIPLHNSNDCPRQEGAPTVIKMPVGVHSQIDDL